MTKHEKPDKEARKAERRFWDSMKGGGARASLQRGQTMYERKGGNQERITYLDRTNSARSLMSSRLHIPDGLRSVGNLYGGSVLMAMLGPGKPFALEVVDGGRHASGGVSVQMIEAQAIATIAQDRMAGISAIKHRCYAKTKHGEHRPITARKLMDSVCAHGMSVSEVALRGGWWVDGPKSLRVPPTQISKLTAFLVDILRAIDEEWGQNGIDARGLVGVVEPR